MSVQTNKPDTSNRVALVELPVRVLMNYMGLPEGLRVHGVQIELSKWTGQEILVAKIEHESLPETREGEPIPRANPLIHFKSVPVRMEDWGISAAAPGAEDGRPREAEEQPDDE